MARIILDDLWLCTDCTIAAVNDDYSGMEEPRALEVQCAIVAVCKVLGGPLVYHADAETGEGIKDFSWFPCHCCGSRLGGERTRFAVIK
jgi:hypothetical protein